MYNIYNKKMYNNILVDKVEKEKKIEKTYTQITNLERIVWFENTTYSSKMECPNGIVEIDITNPVI